MVGAALNILPRMKRPFGRMRAVFVILLVLVIGLAHLQETNAQNLINSGQINNTGTIRIKNQAVGLPSAVDGRFEYFGTDQTVSPVQYKVLVLSGSGTKASSAGNFVVTDSLRLASGVVFSVDSGSVVFLSGSLEEQGYLLGKIRKSVDLSGGTTSSAFGNIGTTINWTGTAPGVTTVTRSSGVALNGNGNQSIQRYYDINPATNSGLNADLVFGYRNNELNGHDPANLQLWKSTDGGSTWLYVDAISNPGTQTISRSGIESFSLWTAADTANYPLGLVQTFARIVVQHYVDADGNLSTTGDRYAYPWSIVVHRDSLTGQVIGETISDTMLDVRANLGGMFYIVENDSSGWTRLGFQRDNSAPVSSAVNTVGFSAFPPQTTYLKYYTFKNGTISGTVFTDMNTDSIRGAGDAGIPNWKIYLKKNGVLIDSTLTLSDGSYSFANLSPATYMISAEQQQDWLQTLPRSGGLYTITLLSGQTYANRNFGEYHYGSVAGTVFEDLEGDGVMSSGEPPLGGWIVRLLRGSVQVDSIETGIDGTYLFNELTPGVYSVHIQQQSGWLLTVPVSGEYASMTIGNDIHFTGLDFGNYRAGTISGIVYYDRNANGIFDSGENGLSGWTIQADAVTPANSQTVVTLSGGSYSFNALRPDTYTLSLTMKPNWLQTAPASVTYTLLVVSSSVITDQNFGVAAPLDSLSFRTFTVDSLAVLKPNSKRTCIGFRFAFDFKNRTGRKANGLYIEFNNVVTQFTTYTPFVEAIDLGNNAQDYRFVGTEIDTAQTVRIEGFSVVTPCNIRVSKWWWTWDEMNISLKKSEGPLRTTLFTKSVRMPNPANVRDETFTRGFALDGGLKVGIVRSDSVRVYGWVRIKKSLDLYKSLYDKFTMHVGPARGLAVFSNNGRIAGEQKTLSPLKHNNKLFAELAALKFNIEASTRGITPAGFGELVYDEESNPLSGMIIKDIASHADTMMTFWKHYPMELYVNLDTTVRKLNRSFSGPMDTISYITQFKVKGTRALSEVSYLRIPVNIEPLIRAQQDAFAVYAELPREFLLSQNYPNPFNPVTMIDISLPMESEVTVTVYNVLGQEVVTLLEKQVLDPGTHQVEFYADGLATGIYFYKMVARPMDEGEESGSVFVDTKKMMYVK